LLVGVYNMSVVRVARDMSRSQIPANISTKFLFQQTIWNTLTAWATSRRNSAPHGTLPGKMLDYKPACMTTVTHRTEVGDILPECRVGLFQRDSGLKKKNLHMKYLWFRIIKQLTSLHW